MIMENENVQQPTYEQLIQAYTGVIQENQQLKSALQSIQTDKLLERLQLIMRIVENKDKYSEQIVKCAEGYLLDMLKPHIEEK